MPKVKLSAKDFIAKIQSSKGSIDIKNLVQKSIHQMTSSIIWGIDVNEKVKNINYINYETGRQQDLTLQEAYNTLLTDFAKVLFNPIYLFLEFAKYLPFGKMANIRWNQ